MYSYPQKELLAWLTGELKVEVLEEETDNGKIVIEKTWDDFSLWESRSELVEKDQLCDMEMELLFDVHSKKLIEGFKIYLEKEERLSDKVIRRHINNIEFFMDFLLSSTIYSPLRDGSDLMEYFYLLINRYVIETDSEFNRQMATLKKFYNFLYYVGEINKEELQEKKEDLKDAKEIIFDY